MNDSNVDDIVDDTTTTDDTVDDTSLLLIQNSFHSSLLFSKSFIDIHHNYLKLRYVKMMMMVLFN